MKIQLLLLLAIGVFIALGSSCAHLAGTRIDFDDAGNPVITAPQRPIVITPRK